MGLIELLIILILIFWAFSFFPSAPYHGSGGWIHFLLVLVVLLVVLRFMGVL